MKPHIYLIFHGRYPSEKAASLFAAKSADAFAGEGYTVTLLVPRRLGRLRTDHAQFYRLKNQIKVVYLPTLDLFFLGILQNLAFRLSLFVFSKWSFLYLLFHAKKNDVIYSNETLPLLFASLRFPRTVIEVHDYPERSLGFHRLLFKRVAHILVTTEWKLKQFKKDFPASADKVFYEPNAVSVEEFAISMSKEEARKKLSLPFNAKIVVYTGHLYGWKGVGTLAEAAKHVADTLLYVVGGTEKDIATFKREWRSVSNLRVVGHRPHAEIPMWQKAADVLVLPNTAKEEISTHYTSPMKLFEYMASGTPIVASDIPSIREITGNDRAVLVAPDNANALAEGIKKALARETASSQKALGWAQEHTWQKRASRILAKLS